MPIEKLLSNLILENKILRRESYKNYHETIRRIVTDDSSDFPKLDVQLAAIYELRFYEQYYDCSLRIMEHLKKTWENSDNKEYYFKEFEEAKKYILKKQEKMHSFFSTIYPFILYPIIASMVYFIFLLVKEAGPKIVDLIF